VTAVCEFSAAIEAGNPMQLRKRPKLKIIIEKYKDVYVGYPIGMKGVVVGKVTATRKC
jgi:hypothetical protein